ncbi:ATP-dependent helicase [Actinotalea sp. M2MS4P-6]|uniref:ATP-dependent helicase n=1 Tax=Actinotalea sp. M2MS4P-6 TaxID=2983762 RepID=UPI0021E39925|nr:ATP-dependent helicase [Actinotalea sp. M2MS4P-6]MCV2396148.1 ATP-dependent helicase [Actinotalea sp. M2MS4P-6]
MTPPTDPATAAATAGFSSATRAWFAETFEAPTAAQAGAWSAVRAGDHALVVAPTGSGKTLAAFLWSIDRLLVDGPPQDPTQRCRVLYVSPLKALATDVERNLRTPLVGIRRTAAAAGVDLPPVTVGVRTGDTPPAERRAFATRPPDVLITTPESLFLVLTSAARSGLAGVRTVILDEIHAVAGTKRGAHLAVSLERLDAFLEEHGGPAQRVGLSATVRPVDAVARFLGGARREGDGGRPVTVVQPPAAKQVEVEVVVPVPDLTELTPRTPEGATGDDGTAGSPDGGPVRRPSIWPHVEERVVDLVASHRSTLVFANSRRGAERLTARMNEVWAERRGEDVPDHGALNPAQVTAQSGAAVGVEAVLARAHHGSMSRAERTRTEDELKAGRLPAVVATSSLELGIDMGAVDLVVQVGAPPSVASGLQRIGRAGHQVGAVSRGVMFPTFRGELAPAAVVAERMRTGAIEELHVPANPLDVLAQQVVAMVATEDWHVDDLAAVVRRAAPFATLGDASLRAVLDMLAGRYPSEEFGELRPRLVWDRAAGLLHGRPGALRLAATSGGTIPDRGLYGVFLAGSEREGTRGGLRVGELDEEMVYESRVGDTFTLGSSTWRIEDITPDRVLVSPAPGQPGRLPFWKGDSMGRPAELGRAIGGWLRETAALPEADAAARSRAAGLDAWAADNLVAYLREQREATGRLPDDTTIVVERFRDEIGDWRVVVHSPFGARVHAPWALVLAGRLRERHGLDVAVMHSDDGIVLRLPDAVATGEATWDTAAGQWSVPEAPGVDLADLLVEPEQVATAVQEELGASTIFAARFREAAARALLLPRRRPDRRQPLWQQRQRSAQLLQVASAHPEFPILLEAARECLQDDFDTAELTRLMADVAARRVQVVEVTTTQPSPFAQSLLFGYTAQFLYEGDAPLAERRAAALTLDPALLAELLAGEAPPLADLLDPDAVLAVEAEVGGTAPDRRAQDLEQLADVLRRHGPLDLDGVLARTADAAQDDAAGWLDRLVESRRALAVRVAGRTQWAVVEDAARLRDALGVALPPGVPAELAAPVPDPLGDLVRRHARGHGPFTVHQVAERFALPPAAVAEVLHRLGAGGAIVVGRLRPEVLGGTGEDHCDAEVLRRIRRRSLAALRAEVEPVPSNALARFLPEWQQVTGVDVVVEPTASRVPGSAPATVRRAAGRGLRGVDGVARVVEQLAGFALPASAWETLVLPARVADYSPAMLDELTAAGEVVWAGHGSLATRDGLVSLHPASTADLTVPPPLDGPSGPVHDALRAALGAGGGWFLDALADRVADTVGEQVAGGTVVDALWDLVWSGEVSNDGVAVLRARLGGRGTTHKVRAAAPRGRALRSGLSLRAGPRAGAPRADGAGRWSTLPARETDPTAVARATAAQLLDRHGVLTRAVAAAERVAGRFTDVYRVLAGLEETGTVRRGYFVEHLGGSQFALPGAVDELRAERPDGHAVVLAATDPANPFGAALPWPAGSTGHRPGRTAGALVVVVDGDLAFYLERGGRTVLSFPGDRDETAAAAHLAAGSAALADLVRTGRLGRVTLRRLDGAEVLDRAVLSTPAATALQAAGFAATPRGLRIG